MQIPDLVYYPRVDSDAVLKPPGGGVRQGVGGVGEDRRTPCDSPNTKNPRRQAGSFFTIRTSGPDADGNRLACLLFLGCAERDEVAKALLDGSYLLLASAIELALSFSDDGEGVRQTISQDGSRNLRPLCLEGLDKEEFGCIWPAMIRFAQISSAAGSCLDPGSALRRSIRRGLSLPRCEYINSHESS